MHALCVDFLDFFDNAVSAIPAAMGNLTNLTFLDLTLNAVNEIAPEAAGTDRCVTMF